MREFIVFLTAILILAIAQTLYAALGVVLLIFAVMGVVAFPRRTFQLIAALGLLGLSMKAPVACAVVAGSIAVAAMIVSVIGRRQTTKDKILMIEAPKRFVGPR